MRAILVVLVTATLVTACGQAATPDTRAAILADLAALDQAGQEAYSPLLLGCLTLGRTSEPAFAAYNQRNYDASQVFLRQHPALDLYATWFYRQGNGLTPVCASNLRAPQNLDRYLATR